MGPEATQPRQVPTSLGRATHQRGLPIGALRRWLTGSHIGLEWSGDAARSRPCSHHTSPRKMAAFGGGVRHFFAPCRPLAMDKSRAIVKR